ncbi:MAG: flagellar basal body-associated FliL family protein [Verrucomicrobiota bacterium]
MSDKPEEKKDAPAAEHGAAPAESKGVSTGMFFGVVGAMVLFMLGGVFAMWKFMVAPTLEKIQAPPAAVASSEGEAPAAAEHGAAKAEHGEGKKEGKEGKEGGEGKKEGKEGKEGGEAKKEGEHGGSSHASGSGKGLGEFPLSDILVNVSGTRAGRVLKSSISFHAPQDVIQELETNQAKVRDLIIQILSRKTMDELTSPTAYGMIRTEIITNINALLTEGKVDSVSFTEFIIQ